MNRRKWPLDEDKRDEFLPGYLAGAGRKIGKREARELSPAPGINPAVVESRVRDHTE
jgi:hypothetical protein